MDKGIDERTKGTEKGINGTETGIETVTETGTGTGSGSSGNTNTTGTGRGSGRGRGTGRKTKSKSGEEVLELPNVNIPNIPTPEEKKEKKKETRGRKPKKDNALVTSEQISSLLIASSSILATREGFSHWLLSEAEANQIAEPLANIIAKNESLKALGEHADAIALVTACLMIFAPRIFTTVMINKSKPKKEILKDDRKSKNSIKPSDGKATKSEQNDDISIGEFIPSII